MYLLNRRQEIQEAEGKVRFEISGTPPPSARFKGSPQPGNIQGPLEAEGDPRLTASKAAGLRPACAGRELGQPRASPSPFILSPPWGDSQQLTPSSLPPPPRPPPRTCYAELHQPTHQASHPQN